MRLEKKTTATLLIAIFILSTLAIAIPVNATEGIILGKSGDGYAIWTYEQDYQSEYSVKLHTGTTYPDWGFMKIPIEPVLLQALEDEPSYWVFEPIVLSGGRAPLQSGDHHPWGHPYINMVLDLDGNPATIDKDYLEGIGSTAGTVTDGTAVNPDPSTWTEMTEGWGYWDSDDTISFGFSGQDLETGAFIYHSLADWKAEMLDDYPDATVVEVQICYGYWPTEITAQCNPVYVDDMTIDGVTYALEPSSDVLLKTNADGFTLDVTIDGTGTVDIVPLEDLYPLNDPVTLTANPGTDWHFDHWSGDVPSGDEEDNPLSIIMDGNKAITAHFVVDIVSIYVTPTSVDFGELMMGDISGSVPIKIENMGNVDVTVTAGVTEEPAFYSIYLRIGGSTVSEYLEYILTEALAEPGLILDLTTCREPGIHEGTLIFTAVET